MGENQTPSDQNIKIRVGEPFWTTPNVLFWFVNIPAISFAMFESFKYLGWRAVFFWMLAFLGAAFLVWLLFHAKVSEKTANALLPFFIIFFLLTAIVAIVAAGINYLSLISKYIWLPLSPFIFRNHLENPINFFAAFLLLGIAVAAYKVRCRYRVLYGLIELLVGFATFIWGIHTVDLFQAFEGLGNNLDLVVAKTLAGLFIVVRGLNNVHEGLLKRSENKNNFIEKLLKNFEALIS